MKATQFRNKSVRPFPRIGKLSTPFAKSWLSTFYRSFWPIIFKHSKSNKMELVKSRCLIFSTLTNLRTKEARRWQLTSRSIDCEWGRMRHRSMWNCLLCTMWCSSQIVSLRSLKNSLAWATSLTNLCTSLSRTASSCLRSKSTKWTSLKHWRICSWLRTGPAYPCQIALRSKS